jgi:hypothetical protein
MAAQAAWYRERGDTHTAGRLEAALDAQHCCRVCGRQLTDPDSIRRGVGGTCWTKKNAIQWPYRADEIDAAIDRHPSGDVA